MNIEESKAIFVGDYYSLTFLCLHKKLYSLGFNPCSIHPIRESYWKNIPEGKYSSEESIKLVSDYLTHLLSLIEELISKNSLAYWIHLLRRMACNPRGCGDKRDDSLVVLWVRLILEASIQKYGIKELCNRVGISGKLDIHEILNGFFSEQNLEMELESLLNNYPRKSEIKEDLIKWANISSESVQTKSQLVLTNFGLDELNEFYELEGLAYEVWRSGANIRGLTKGASLAVIHHPFNVAEIRDDTLEASINIYDDRRDEDLEDFFIAKGTYHPLDGDDNSFLVFLPTYNVGGIPVNEFMYEIFNGLFNKQDVELIVKDEITNFIWFPINLNSYYKSNLLYSESFKEMNNINLESVLAVLAAILIQAMDMWVDNYPKMFEYWQRGYVGPYNKEDIIQTIKEYLSISADLLGVKEELIDIKGGYEFWALNDDKREMIDLVFPGPHSVFLSCCKDKLFINYAAINARLYYLFWNCTCINENFKGTALELLIQNQDKMVLPSTQLHSHNGTSKQIDASFGKDDTLLILECKASGTSIGYERGNKKSLEHRIKGYKEAIKEVDEKAEWLIKEKEGTNFNINKFNKIIPIVITPFKEYIRCDERKYWLTNKIPRILTPLELKELLSEENIWESKENVLIKS